MEILFCNTEYQWISFTLILPNVFQHNFYTSMYIYVYIYNIALTPNHRKISNIRKHVDRLLIRLYTCIKSNLFYNISPCLRIQYGGKKVSHTCPQGWSNCARQIGRGYVRRVVFNSTATQSIVVHSWCTRHSNVLWNDFPILLWWSRLMLCSVKFVEWIKLTDDCVLLRLRNATANISIGSSRASAYNI